MENPKILVSSRDHWPLMTKQWSISGQKYQIDRIPLYGVSFESELFAESENDGFKSRPPTTDDQTVVDQWSKIQNWYKPTYEHIDIEVSDLNWTWKSRFDIDITWRNKELI